MGCIPSKTLLKHGKAHSIQMLMIGNDDEKELNIDFLNLYNVKESGTNTTGGVKQLLKKNVAYIEGEASISKDLNVK